MQAPPPQSMGFQQQPPAQVAPGFAPQGFQQPPQQQGFVPQQQGAMAGFGRPPAGGGGGGGFAASGAIFGGVENAKARRGGNYIRPSHCLMMILKCVTGKSTTNGDFFAAELVCLDDLDPQSYRDGPQGTAYGHRVGEEVSIMHMTKHPSFMGNVKAFIANATGQDESAITQDLCNTIVGPANPLRYTVIELVARDQRTKSNNFYTSTSVKGVVPWATVKQHLLTKPDGAERINKFFPNGLLDQLIAAEMQQKSAAPPQAAPQQQYQQPPQQQYQQPPQGYGQPQQQQAWGQPQQQAWGQPQQPQQAW